MDPFKAPPLRLLDLNAYHVFLGMVTAFILSFILVRVSAFTTRKSPASSSANVPETMILLSAIVSLIMSIIGNSLARAFGAIGALSLIRFRTAIKDPIDLAKIFMSISIGMASGSGYPQIAVGATALYSLFLALIQYAAPKASSTKVMLLKLNFDTKPDYQKDIDKLLSNTVEKFKILSQELTNENKSCQLILEIKIPNATELPSITAKLTEILPNLKVLVING